MHIHLVHLGRVGYREGLEAQARVVAARKAGAIGYTLLSGTTSFRKAKDRDVNR